MLNFPYIFTFYSYKGGVGRSLALLNTAYTLAGRGRHVLVVDMDLEAPGISGFLQRNQELAEPETSRPLDILDLLEEATNGVRGGKNPAEVLKTLPPVSTYMRTVAPNKLDPLSSKLGEVGRLDFLIVDEERDYWRRFAELGIQTLTREQLVNLSKVLHHYFKAQRFPHRPFGLEPFEAPISTPYDYVLVDSRTGVTELGGLCVGPLADRLVVVTGLNDQNIHGTLSFLKETGIEPKERTEKDEPWDEADITVSDDVAKPSLGPKPTLVVASPVPAGEIEFKQKRMEELHKALKIKPVPLSYHPQIGLMESIFIRDYPEEYLALEYERLADQIMARVRDHYGQLAERSQKPWDQDFGPFDSARILLRLAAHNFNLGFNLLIALLTTPRDRLQAVSPSRCHHPQRVGDLRRSFSKNGLGPMESSESNVLIAEKEQDFFILRRIYALLTKSSIENRLGSLINWGLALLAQAETKQGAEADQLFEAAGNKYAEAVRIKPDYHEAFNSWGIAFSFFARIKTAAEADRFFETAGNKYAEAVRIKPDYHEAFSNWGVALSCLARIKPAAEADRLFEAAGEKYAAAVRIKPDYYEAYFNWGVALSHLARIKPIAEADRFFEAAGEKYAAAVRIKPDYYEANFNWGVALSLMAGMSTGDKADWLFEMAGEKFKEALRFQPDLPEAYKAWGISFSAQGNTKQGAKTGHRFEAREEFMEVVRIKPVIIMPILSATNYSS